MKNKKPFTKEKKEDLRRLLADFEALVDASSDESVDPPEEDVIFIREIALSMDSIASSTISKLDWLF